jgi:AraC-like DNA-binding protein
LEPIDRLNQAIYYIEENLCADIDYNEISKITLSPITAFQRFFYLTTGLALSEYIRRRKLSCAAHDLQNTDFKVIDIAYKYGYESPDAFSVAFKRLYNIAPSTARQSDIKLEPFHRLYFELSVKYIKGDVIVKKITELVANVNDVEIFEMPELMLIGKEIRYGGKLDFLGNRAPELWDLCIEDGSLDVIRALPSLIPNAIIGWNGNYTSEDETFSYIVGAFVPLGTPVPRGYACRILPATFVAKGIYDTGYAMIDTYKSWGYTQNYDLFGWNGELYFKDDPSPIKWSQITPVKKA